MQQYKIVSGFASGSLAVAVNKELANGWKLQGSPFNLGGHDGHAQALVKEVMTGGKRSGAKRSGAKRSSKASRSKRSVATNNTRRN